MTEFVSNDALRSSLREPFPRELIGTLPRGGVSLDFVGHAAVTDRLNKVAPDWTYRVLRVVEADISGMPHVVAVHGEMTIGGVTREEVGDVDRPSHYGQEFQIALGNFIRRGAMRFGVGIDLWSKEDLSSLAVPPAAGDRSAEPVAADPVSGTGPDAAGTTGAAGTGPVAPASRPTPPKPPAKPHAVSPHAKKAPTQPPALKKQYVAPTQPSKPVSQRPPSAVVVPPDSSPSVHFPMWQSRRDGSVCIYPGCLIHKTEVGAAS